MNFVRSQHLRRWSEEIDARTRLPQLVRRLVFASCFPVRAEFPTAEDIQRQGWDGIVEINQSSNFVPEGLSLWEISTEKGIVKKAEEDLAKRAKKPLGFEKKKATVVFVTSRSWPKTVNKRSWGKRQCRIGGWRAVRVIDSGDLEAWLENAPSVDWWLAYHLGLRPVGASDFTRRWNELSALSTPALQPPVFLASRNGVVERLNNWIKNNATALSIEATTPGDAIDFIAAWLNGHEDIEARALLVESREAWQALAGPGTPMLLVPHPKLEFEPLLAAAAVANGHHVLVPTQTVGSRYNDAIRLPLVRRHILHEALRSCGFGFEAAARHARETGGHLGVLKRRLAATVGVQPAWSTPEMGAEISPLILAGEWDEAKSGDAEILLQLTSKNFAEVTALVRRWAQAEDAPLIQKGTKWRFTSREESWCLLSRYLTTDHLQRFSDIALRVLGEKNPRYDLPVEDRQFAGLRNQTPQHSWELRKGVAEALTLLAVHGEDLNGAGRAEHLVDKLLNGADWQRWASLEMQLPLLAEAAPDAFLGAAEVDLKTANSALVRLFLEEDKGPWSASNPHTGLLWALEVLCWSPDFLSRASLVLAQLSRLDPGGKLCNRPIGSLRGTFLPWAPHTGANAEQRLEVIDRLLLEEPKIIWRLLFSFLPQGHDSTNPRDYPRWRDWGDYDFKEPDHNEYVKQVLAIADRIVAYSQGKTECLPLLVEKLDRFPNEHVNQILARLEKLKPSDLPAKEAFTLWSECRKKIAWLRLCEKKSWSVRDRVNKKLQRVATRFQPVEPLERYSWLFEAGSGMDFHEKDDYQVGQQKLMDARISALKEVFSTHGLQGIRSLAEGTYLASMIGFYVAEQKLFSDDSVILPMNLKEGNERLREFSLGYAAGRFKLGGWDWLKKSRINLWVPEDSGWLSRILPFEPKTWRWFARLGTEFHQAYWKRVSPFPNHKISANKLAEATSLLLDNDRTHAALDMLNLALSQKKKVSHTSIEKALNAFLVTKEQPANQDASQHAAWCIQELLSHLTGKPKLSDENLARLEWAYLHMIMRAGQPPKMLFRQLLTTPRFFAEIVEAAGRKQIGSELSLIEHSRELLHAWKEVPGKTQNGKIDSMALNRWCNDAREECQRLGCQELGDSMIGKLFAYAPSESDGSWPAIAIRECIERTASEALDRGFHTGVFNKRGMTSRGPGEGGDQERKLAAQFRQFADVCKFRWPRTARQLTDLANYYENDARRYDQRALNE